MPIGYLVESCGAPRIHARWLRRGKKNMEHTAIAFKGSLRTALQQVNATDLITLVADRPMDFKELGWYLWKTCRRAHEKVLRRSDFIGVRTDVLHRFIAIFEVTKRQIPHVHLACYTATRIRAEMHGCYRNYWHQHFPASDSFHCRPFMPLHVEYLLKDVYRSHAQRESCGASWLLLPEFCRAGPCIGGRQLASGR